MLADGATLTIIFAADAGANVSPEVSYGKSAQAQYTGSSTSVVAMVPNTAPINLIPHVTLSKSIIAVCGGAGCTDSGRRASARIVIKA